MPNYRCVLVPLVFWTLTFLNWIWTHLLNILWYEKWKFNQLLLKWGHLMKNRKLAHLSWKWSYLCSFSTWQYSLFWISFVDWLPFILVTLHTQNIRFPLWITMSTIGSHSLSMGHQNTTLIFPRTLVISNIWIDVHGNRLRHVNKKWQNNTRVFSAHYSFFHLYKTEFGLSIDINKFNIQSIG